MKALDIGLLALLVCSVCGERELHRHRHSGYSKNNKVPLELPPNTPSELRRLIPIEDDVEYRVVEHKDYNELKVVEECRVAVCGMGRKCMIGQNGQETCVCAQESSCLPGHKLVCGSDGYLYESHCALHRRACVSGKKIYVDRAGVACFQRDLLEERIKTAPNSEEHSMSKKKDLSSQVLPAKAEGTTTKVMALETSDGKFDQNCSPYQFEEFKHLLKIFHCNRLGIANCDNQDSSGKRLLVSRMYQYYDRDGDGYVTIEELTYAQKADNLDMLAHICSLRNLIVYSPLADGIDYIDLVTFYNEFEVYINDDHSKKMEFSGKTKIIYVTTDGYSGVEISCELAGSAASADLIWMRNGFDIQFENTNGISVLPNKSLFITAVNLDHTGNYTCYDQNSQQRLMSQLLVVRVKPIVRSNKVGHVMEGVTTNLRCHVDGIPQPTSQWQISQYDIPNDKERYRLYNENSTLSILSPQSALDSGEYQCLAKSPAGWSRSVTGVGVLTEELYLQDADLPSKGLYLVFHGSGYTTYEAEHCYTSHYVDKHTSDFVSNLQEPSSTLERLCPYEEDCDWGSAVNVENKYVYVSQPSLNRVIVIDSSDNFRPKHVILAKYRVSSLHYMANTDELWILIGNQDQFQTVMILSDASEGPYMKLAPLLPQHSIFDSVDELFMPTLTAFNTTSRYAFSSHYDQYGLSRLDTATISYHGQLDLTQWNCKPTKFHHLAIGGLALVECSDKKVMNLVIDVVTNNVLSEFEPGELHVSPNTRYIVTIQRPDKIGLYYLNDNATISQLYQHTLQIPIDQVKFMESEHSYGYDLAVTSPNGNSLLFLDLKTKKTSVLEGFLSGRSTNTSSESVAPLVATSGEFGEQIMIPSQGALFVINKHYHMIGCEWTSIGNYQLSLWLDV